MKASGFRSEAARDAYCVHYDRAVGLVGGLLEERDVEGPDGVTHVLVAGDPAAPPLVALHAKSFSATMWIPILATLTAGHRVYLLDAPGDLDKSVARRVLRGVDGVVEWIHGTLDRLEVPRATVVGASIGAWMGAHYAMAHPEAVERLALLGPAGLVSRPRARWMLSAVWSVQVRPGRLDAFVDSMAMPATAPVLRADPWAPIVRQFVEGVPTFRARLGEPIPRVAPLDRLAAAAVPVLVLVGRQETLHDGPRAAERFRRHLPQARVILVDDANHMVFPDRTDVVVDELRRFLDGEGYAASEV